MYSKFNSIERVSERERERESLSQMIFVVINYLTSLLLWHWICASITTSTLKGITLKFSV